MVKSIRLSSLIPAGLIVDGIAENEGAIVVSARRASFRSTVAQGVIRKDDRAADDDSPRSSEQGRYRDRCGGGSRRSHAGRSA